MNWWKRLFGVPRDTSSVDVDPNSPSVDAVRLHLSLPVVEHAPDRKVWRDTDGLIVSLDVAEEFDLPTPLTSETVRVQFREMAEARKGGLVEAQLLRWRSTDVSEGIYKWPKGTGFCFTGMLIIPLRRATVVWTLVAGEEGITGVREAVVTDQLFSEGELTLERYEQSWAQDPYDPQYRALGRVDSGALRYMSDDARFDSQFPNHPLSRIRSGFRTILDGLEVDDSVFGSLGNQS